MHSDVSATNRGALKMFREMYMKADPERQSRVIQIHVVQPSKYLSLRMFVAEKWSKDAK